MRGLGASEPVAGGTASRRAGGPLAGLGRSVSRYRFALAGLAAVGAGIAAMAYNGELSHESAGHAPGAGTVALRTSAPVGGGLSLAVMNYQRLRDGHAGVNSPRLPMSGPAMPMSSMGQIGGSLKRGQEQIVVTVSLRNPADRPREYDAGRFLLVKNGREVPLLRPTRSTLGEGRLMAQARVSGSIFFVVKAGTAPLQLRDSATDAVFTLDRGAVSGTGRSTGGHGH